MLIMKTSFFLSALMDPGDGGRVGEKVGSRPAGGSLSSDSVSLCPQSVSLVTDF